MSDLDEPWMVPGLYALTEYSTGEWRSGEDYCPTTETVRATYATDYYMTTVRGGVTAEERAAAFDRWLAAERTEAARSALDYRNAN